VGKRYFILTCERKRRDGKKRADRAEEDLFSKGRFVDQKRKPAASAKATGGSFEERQCREGVFSIV